MAQVTVDFNSVIGQFKPMNAVNNGPVKPRADQSRGNFEEFQVLRIPLARVHDANLCYAYGGPHCVDIHAIFPDFNADENDPASYDFHLTDEYLANMRAAGTQVYYRLGASIEHWSKKYGTLPPADFDKWTRICEHVIMHYNEKWADGYEWNIEYWEIWNEPDLDPDDSENKRTWGGTKAEFFDLYDITSKHLKEQFPDLKIGGPALAHNEEWAEDFLCEMQKRDVQIDFFSWHIYCTEPKDMILKSERIKVLLDKYGYSDAESILNEWNYVRGWTDEYVYSLKTIHRIKGASFVTACMCESQHSSIDMLMYYDTRPSVFNGVFDFYTYEKLKSYFSFYWYGKFYNCKKEIPSENKIENIYSLCGVDSDGKAMIMLTYYSDNDDLPSKRISLDIERKGVFDIYKVDENLNADLIETTDKPNPELEPFSIVFIKEK